FCRCRGFASWFRFSSVSAKLPHALGYASEIMSRINSKCLIFAGPTLNDANALRAVAREGIEVLPPVRRGDIEEIVSTHPPGVMVIVDGLFHQCLSVGHAEIRSAVAAGWRVWGLSSMGAIRAYEMRHLGVRG